MIAGAIEEDLRFVFKAAESARMNDAVAVALEIGAPKRRGFFVNAAATFGAKLGVGSERTAFPFLQFLSGTRHEEARASIIGEQLLHGNAAQLEQATDGVLDEIVGTGRASSDADSDFARREPVARFNFLLFCLTVVTD